MKGVGASALGLLLSGEMQQTEERQTLRLRLDFFDESILLTRYNGGRPVSCYEVSPTALAEALSGLPLTTGVLPQGCLFYARRGGDETIGIYLAPRRYRLTVRRGDERTAYEVPMPGLVFVGHGSSYSIFAVKRQPRDESERLFHAPFPNVHSNGRICPGSVRFPVCSPATIHHTALLFLESEFNGDLVRGKSQRQPDNVIMLWAELQGEETYPLTDLVETPFRLNTLWQTGE